MSLTSNSKYMQELHIFLLHVVISTSLAGVMFTLSSAFWPTLLGPVVVVYFYCILLVVKYT